MATRRWGLLTNHALVLVHVVEHPRSTLRDIAYAVGITDRAALSILRAIEEDGIIARRKEGRRNVYTVDMDALLAHRSPPNNYTIEQIAGAMFALAGRVPGAVLPPGMEVARAQSQTAPSEAPAGGE